MKSQDKQDNLYSLRFSSFVLDKRNRTYWEEGESVLLIYSTDENPTKLHGVDKKKLIHESGGKKLISSMLAKFKEDE